MSGYRNLESGEILQAGDETPSQNRWSPIPTGWVGQVARHPWDALFSPLLRRKITVPLEDCRNE